MRLMRLLKSFKYAFHGIYKVWHEEQNLQIHTLFGLLATLMGVYFGITRTEWLFLVLVILLVILMEVVNSAVERVTDVLKPRIHNYVKEIKDIMAAAVLLSACGAVIIGLIIFVPYLYKISL